MRAIRGLFVGIGLSALIWAVIIILVMIAGRAFGTQPAQISITRAIDNADSTRDVAGGNIDTTVVDTFTLAKLPVGFWHRSNASHWIRLRFVPDSTDLGKYPVVQNVSWTVDDDWDHRHFPVYYDPVRPHPITASSGPQLLRSWARVPDSLFITDSLWYDIRLSHPDSLAEGMLPILANAARPRLFISLLDTCTANAAAHRDVGTFELEMRTWFKTADDDLVDRSEALYRAILKLK